MRALFWMGLLVLVVGVASFFVALPEKHNEGVKIGSARIGVEETTSHKLPPWASGILVAGGIGMMLAGGRGER
jgi:hypothetical protein